MAGQVGETGVHVMNAAEPYRATQLWTGIVESFEHGMEVGRHWRQLKYYDDSFTASEAVTYLQRYLQRNPNFGLSVTRLQTVQLLQKLHKAKVFEDVRGAKYDGEAFTENGSRLYRFCRRTAGPRSPFSFCRALINVRTPGKPISPTEPSGHKKVNRTITFDDKENQMPQEDFHLKRRNIAEDYMPMKQFTVIEDVPVKVLDKENIPLKQVIPVKKATPALKENQSLYGALQQTLLPRIPVLSEVPNSMYAGQLVSVRPLETGAQFVSWKQSKAEETGASSYNKAQQRRALTQVNTISCPKSAQFVTAHRQISTANRNSEESSQFQMLNFQTFKPNTISSLSLATGEERQVRSSTVVVQDTVKQLKPSNLSNAGQQGTVQPINTGIRSTLGLWKKSFARLISEDDLKQRCFAEFKVRLCVVLGVDDLSEFYVPAPGDHENVFCNLTSADGEDYHCNIDRQSSFPAWLRSAMKYLTHWPHEAVGSLPKYSGFEKDVFQTVVGYFEDPDVEPIFRRCLSQAVCRSLVHLKFWPQENTSEAGNEETKKEDEACMETSFGLGTGEPQTRLIHQPSVRFGRAPRGRSCLAQPRVIASPMKNCSNPMSLVASGLDLSQVPDYVEYSGSSLSYLYSMPDVSFLDQPLFDTTAAAASRRSKKPPSYSAFQSQNDLSSASFWGNTEAVQNRGCHHPMTSSLHLSLPPEEALPGTVLNNPIQPVALEAGSVKPMQRDRSQSITHLPAVRCQRPVDSASAAFREKSQSCAYLAQPSRRSCDLNSQPRMDNATESFFLTRSTSRGAVTASYRLAVDKNESFSTPVGKSLFSSASNHHRSLVTKWDHSEKFLDVLQMFSLLLPVSERRCLVTLLRFFSRISANEDLVLDEQLSVRQMVRKHFACAVFHVDDASDDLMRDILAFMVDHYEDVTRIPEALHFVAREFDEKVQDSKAVNKPENGMGGKKDRTSATPKAAPRIASTNPESTTAKIQSRNKMTSMLKKPIQRLKSMRF